MSEKLDPQQYLQEAHETAFQSGSYHINEAGTPYDTGESTPISDRQDIDKNGLKLVRGAEDEVAGYDDVLTRVETSDAQIKLYDDSFTSNDRRYSQQDIITQAATQEPTGIYETSKIIGRPNDPDFGINLEDGVHISRSDGNGGTYEASLTGNHAAEASAIIARRAARRIGSVSVNREMRKSGTEPWGGETKIAA